MPTKITSVGFFVGIVASVLFISNAHAAPQVLALLSTQGPVPLTCQGGECAATFSSFCLQGERPSPPGGTPYQLAEAGAVKITGINRHGRKISLDPQRELTLTAVRTQVAVRISLPQQRLAELGLERISVTVGENVTLVPVPQPGDANPLSESDIALAKDVLRTAGSRIVDANGVGTATVRWLANLINELPAGLTGDTALRQAAVERAVAGPLQSLSPAAGEIARDALASCKLDVQLEIYKSYRRCLEASHDAYLWNLNADYWQAVKTGS